MSFSSECKEELLLIPMKNSCCRRAFLRTLMLGARSDGESVTLGTDNHLLAEFAVGLLAENESIPADIGESTVVGRKKYTVSFSSRKYAALTEGLPMTAEGIEKAVGIRCPGCRQTILRALFLLFGSVTDPHCECHAEFLIPDARRAEKVDAYLADLGIPARRIARREKIGLYYKNSNSLEELFAEMGASPVVFRLMNLRIERDIRNQENRATNCVAKNIGKTVDASQKQIAAIIKLKDRGILENLPEDLRVTAELRLEYDSASLTELAGLHEPPISKSGLSHRLSKLSALAEKA